MDIEDLTQLTSSELLNHCGDDADKWAAAFMAIIGPRPGPHPVDHDVMRAWFANAIVRGQDEARWRREREESAKPDWDHFFMDIARVTARRASCDRKKVGAVIVIDNRVIAGGYNGAPSGWPSCDEVGHQMVEMSGGRMSCVRTIHAEENALMQCAKYGITAHGATCYTTASPCYDCFKRLAQVGVWRIVHAEAYDGARSHGIDMKELAARHGIKMEMLP